MDNSVFSEKQNGIKGWPASERPREKLFRSGAEALSDADLVALLLRNGLKGKDAVALGRELIGCFGSLRALLAAGAAELQAVKGLGSAKVASLLAVSEMAKRQLREEICGKNYARDPEAVVLYLTASLRDLKKEIFKVLFLNKANRILEEKDLFHGTVDETAVHPREVVKAALELHATAVILVHNHPSGRIQPSPEDREITRRIQLACRTVGIKVLDHIIVGDNQYFSFNEHQLID